MPQRQVANGRSAAQLQASIGNQAVLRALQSYVRARPDAHLSQRGDRDEIAADSIAAAASRDRPGIPRDAVPAASGAPLPPSARAYFEQRLATDLSDVRVHHGPAAARASRLLGADAFTVGNDISFASGRYDLSSPAGFHLAAHELAHVSQQRAGSPTIHRFRSADTESPQLDPDKTVASRPADPGIGEGIDLTFILTAAPRDEQFVKDYIEGMTSYVKEVLRAGNVYEVPGLAAMFDVLKTLSEFGDQKVRRIRIVGHAWNENASKKTIGGSVLTRDRVTKQGLSTLTTPAEVREFAQQKENRETIAKIMRPGAVVEFWGCNLGQYEDAKKVWADLFQSTFVATTEKVAALERKYYLVGPDGKKTQARSSGEVKGPKGRAAFNRFLLNVYNQLLQAGEIEPIAGDTSTIIGHMRNVFNRSRGSIPFMAVQDAKGKRGNITPDRADEWKAVWVSFPSTPIAALADEGAPAPSQDKPAPPPEASVSPQPSPAQPTVIEPPVAEPPVVAPPVVEPPVVEPPVAPPPVAATPVVEAPAAPPPAAAAPVVEPPAAPPSEAEPPTPAPPAPAPAAPAPTDLAPSTAQPEAVTPTASEEPTAPTRAPVAEPEQSPEVDAPPPSPAREQSKTPQISTIGQERQWEAEHREGAVTTLGSDHLILWNFGVNSYELKPEHIAAIDAFARRAQFALLGPSVRIRIDGYASRTGSARNNLDLTISRANAAFNRLIDRGIAGDKCDLDWHGSGKPWFPNVAGGASARNRRVELRLIGATTSAPAPEPRQQPEPPRYRRAPAEPEVKLGEVLPGGSMEFKKEFDPKYPVALGPYVVCYPTFEIAGRFKLKTKRDESFNIQFTFDKGLKGQVKKKLNEVTELKLDSSGNFGLGFKHGVLKSEVMWDWKKLATQRTPLVYGISATLPPIEVEYPEGSGAKWSIEFEPVKGKFALGPSPLALAQLGISTASTTTGVAAAEGIAAPAAAFGVAEAAVLGGIGVGIGMFVFSMYHAVRAGQIGEQHARIFARHVGLALRLAGEVTGDYGYREALSRMRQGMYYEDAYDGWRDADKVLERSSAESKEQLRRLGAKYGPLAIDPFVMALLWRTGAYDFKPLPLNLDDVVR